MEKFCKEIRRLAAEIINYKKREMIPLTDKATEFYEKQKVCYICRKEFSADKNEENEFELYHKVRDLCHYTGKFRGTAHNICNLRYKVPKEIPVLFHNGSTYDYYLIIKELAKEFDGQFECLGENMEKYITFSVPVRKELCRPHYQVLSIICLKFTKKECKGCMEKKNQVRMQFYWA